MGKYVYIVKKVLRFILKIVNIKNLDKIYTKNVMELIEIHKEGKSEDILHLIDLNLSRAELLYINGTLNPAREYYNHFVGVTKYALS